MLGAALLHGALYNFILSGLWQLLFSVPHTCLLTKSTCLSKKSWSASLTLDTSFDSVIRPAIRNWMRIPMLSLHAYWEVATKVLDHCMTLSWTPSFGAGLPFREVKLWASDSYSIMLTNTKRPVSTDHWTGIAPPKSSLRRAKVRYISLTISPRLVL